ncbi:hypothetical protein [Halobacterium zhouii]|uniref:hypothetical protein n=1 Tax=Halobacterium zhouii TaxID=2902624 RepID=UPI001E34A4C2|nr:hypothetical protein [Halobacterium zhouii]
MSGYGVPSLSDDEKEIVRAVVDTFDHSEINHLKEIFEGTPTDLRRYYGENPSEAGTKRGVAESLVREHPEEVEGILHDIDNTTLKKNEFEKNLVAEGIPGELVDELEPTTRRLMVFAYHLLYNEEDFGAKLRLLKLNSRLFKETTERTYKYGRERFDLENFEGEVKRHVRQRNADLHRPFTIRYHEDEDNDTIFLDFYKETARVMQNIFKRRKDGLEETDASYPTVTHESGYAIKTLLCRVDTSSDEAVKFVFKTNPTSRWKSEMEKFFESVAHIENPFDEANQEVDEGASEVLDAAVETAREDEVSVEDVEQAVTGTMQDLVDESPDDDLPDISEGDIKWVGWVVDDDEDTMIESDDFTARTPLQNYIQDTPGASDRLFHVLDKAEEGNLGLRFRSDFGDGNNERFIVRSKFWTEDAQVDEAARNILNTIFRGDGDAD